MNCTKYYHFTGTVDNQIIIESTDDLKSNANTSASTLIYHL